MLTYVARRIVATIPVMAVVALFVFSLLYIAPGDPAAVIAGDQATPADVERIGPTLSLMVLTLGLSVAVAVPIGVMAAWKAGTWIDRLVMAFAVFGFSV